MSKAFIAQVIQESTSVTGTAANRAAGDVVAAIIKEMKKAGKFTLPSFGTFTVRKTKARKGMNPRTGESIKVKAGKTVRFKASPSLKKSVGTAGLRRARRARRESCCREAAWQSHGPAVAFPCSQHMHTPIA
jgi:DNA-binding protein HU-beta